MSKVLAILLLLAVLVGAAFFVLRQLGVYPAPAPHEIKVTVPDVNF